MKTKIFSILCAGFIGVSLLAGPVLAAEEETKAEAKETKAEAKETKAEVKKPKISSAFLNRWKKIQSVTKKQAYETQQTRTVAGVRGAEAEDAILDQLYYKGGVRYPSRVDLKNAITQMQGSIKADPKAEAVPEMKFFIAQCHAQLGLVAEAKATYTDLVKNHAGTDYAGLAQGELDGLK